MFRFISVPCILFVWAALNASKSSAFSITSSTVTTKGRVSNSSDGCISSSGASGLSANRRRRCRRQEETKGCASSIEYHRSATTALSSSTATATTTLFSTTEAAAAVMDVSDGVFTPINEQAIQQQQLQLKQLSRVRSKLTHMGMMLYIASMCIALPATLLPQQLLYKAGFISKVRKEIWAIETAKFCARWLLRIIPFAKIRAIPATSPEDDEESDANNNKPAIWVCNHTSMLDIFMCLAADKKLRGHYNRAMKVVYWQGLETNPVSKLLFQQAGCIPVKMADNGNGNANDYDVRSFKQLLKDCKTTCNEGFDVLILPEGQLNPTSERGLLPVYSGAYTLAKMTKRPMRFMALHGIDKLWHPTKGMICTDRNVSIRRYAGEGYFTDPQDFVAAFNEVVGHFGRTGHDLPSREVKAWLSGGKSKKLPSPATEANE